MTRSMRPIGHARRGQRNSTVEGKLASLRASDEAIVGHLAGVCTLLTRKKSPSSTPSRLPFIDLVRAVGAQLIVWHHLAFYGPLSEKAHAAAPLVFDWLVDYARMAVQGFLVMGGFFTARSFSRMGTVDARGVMKTLRLRFLRIGLPYWVTLVIAVLSSEVARRHMTDEAISQRPTFLQVIAHMTFLHDVFDFEALSAGVWYLAIDLQLFMLTLLVFWATSAALRARRDSSAISPWQWTLLIASPLAMLSLFWFNRNSHLDTWALYFFGSYFLGLLLHETLVRPALLVWFLVYTGLCTAIGLIDSRPRIVVAAAIVVIVIAAQRTKLLERWPNSRVIGYLGKSSYSLFLVHFPILLVVNAVMSNYSSLSTGLAVFGLVFSYAMSLVAASLLYHMVEKRVR